jgi:hypothetical protein
MPNHDAVAAGGECHWKQLTDALRKSDMKMLAGKNLEYGDIAMVLAFSIRR